MTLEIYGRSPKGAGTRLQTIAALVNDGSFAHGGKFELTAIGTAAPETTRVNRGIKPVF